VAVLGEEANGERGNSAGERGDFGEACAGERGDFGEPCARERGDLPEPCGKRGDCLAGGTRTVIGISFEAEACLFLVSSLSLLKKHICYLSIFYASANKIEFQYSLDLMQGCLNLELVPRARGISDRLQGRDHRWLERGAFCTGECGPPVFF
jgi:hypothetical protein